MKTEDVAGVGSRRREYVGEPAQSSSKYLVTRYVVTYIATLRKM